MGRSQFPVRYASAARLCGPATPVQVIEGKRVVEAVVVEIYNATIIVRANTHRVLQRT